MDDHSYEDFMDVVGSESFDTCKEEFVAGVKKCGKSKFTFDEATQTIEFTEACPSLVIHYPELYTEIFCKECQICVEINRPGELPPIVADTEFDELDEFMNIAGTDTQEYGYGDDQAVAVWDSDCEADDDCGDCDSTSNWG